MNHSREEEVSQEYDEKGKHFTVVINKEPIRVNIRTLSGRIEGVLHLHPSNRLVDELNQGETPFMAITQVTVSADGEEIGLPFLVLRKDTIEWIFPSDEQIESPA